MTPRFAHAVEVVGARGAGQDRARVFVREDGIVIGALLVVSDGYGPDLATAARTFVDLVRLPAGGLQDDVSIVLCRQLR